VSRLEALVARSPAVVAAGRWNRRRLCVLAYHGVDDRPNFERQLDWILEHRRPVDLDEALAVLDGSVAADGAVLFTFDDGHRSVLEAGVPAMVQRRVPGVLFVVAALVGTDAPYWWDEVESLSLAGGTTSVVDATAGRQLVSALKLVPDASRRQAIEELRASAPTPARRRPQLQASELREIERHGIVIGNHSYDHPILERCDADGLERQVGASHALLSEAIGHPPAAFAYPNGDEDDRVVAAVDRAGYRVAFRFDHRLAVTPSADRLRVGRVRVATTTTLDRFRMIVTGLHPALHHAVGRR